MAIAFAIVGIPLGLVILLGIGWLVANVDDWSRDLTTNTASTSPDAKNPSLRPISTTASMEILADLVASSAGELPGWELVGRDEAAGEVTLRFVRTTRLMRFKDDITVHIRSLPQENAPPGSELAAESKSRLGKADFGQNPRNLRELMDKVRSSLP